MNLNGLHLLLTYQCTLECDHCFAWEALAKRDDAPARCAQYPGAGAPCRNCGVDLLRGGEPFLYYALLLKGVQRAAAMGFRVGVVSNAYWATSVEDAVSGCARLAGCGRSIGKQRSIPL